MTFPNLRILIDKKRPHYQDFMLTDKGRAARSELLNLESSFDLSAMHDVIESCPAISSVRRDFYHTLLEVRFEVILKPALELARMERNERIEEKAPARSASEPSSELFERFAGQTISRRSIVDSADTRREDSKIDGR